MIKQNRFELEKSLVSRDKQALISDCLKLFDSNQQLGVLLEESQNRVREQEEMIEGLVARNKELKARTWFRLLREKLKI